MKSLIREAKRGGKKRNEKQRLVTKDFPSLWLCGQLATMSDEHV